MRTFATLLGLVSLVPAATAQSPGLRSHRVTSPDGQTELRVEVGPVLTYAVTHRGGPLLTASPISLALDDGRVLGRDAVLGPRAADADSVVRGATKNAVVPDHFRAAALPGGTASSCARTTMASPTGGC
jgi:hypothetical protein